MNFKLSFATLLVAISIVGCGGSGSSVSSPNSYAGTYTGSTTVDGGKRAELSTTVGSDGTLSGTLQISAPLVVSTTGRGGRGDFSFSIGTFNISGTADANGNMTATGTDPIGGAFSISGTLATSGNGSFAITAGGTTYNGTISVSIGSGTGNLTISGATGSNVNTAAWPSSPYILISEASGLTAFLAIPAANDNSRNLNLMVEARAVTGETYPIDPSNLASVTIFTYSDGTGANTKTWIAQSGTFKVLGRSAGKLKFELKDAVFTPSNDSGNLATGSFTLNGIVGNL